MSLLSFALIAQPNDWWEDSPSDFEPIRMVSDFDMVTEGSRAIQIVFTETGTPYFVSDTFNVAAGAEFTLSMDILDNDPAGDVNLRVRFINAAGEGTNFSSPDYSANNPDYQTYSFTDTSPADAEKAYVIIRMYDDADNWDGDCMFHMDNGSFSQDGGTTNVLPNPGFENWPAPEFDEGAMLYHWWEDSPSDWTPITIEPELTNVSHGDVAAKITFTETGTPYFVSDTFNVNPGTEFTFSVDILDNDVAGDVNQRVRFINAAGEGTNMSSGDYSANDPAYQTYTYTDISPADAEKAYVILRMYDDADNWDGDCMYYLDNASFMETGGKNLLANRSFEEWMPSSTAPEFISFSFEGLDPAVSGDINKMDYTVSLTVPYATDLSALVATFEISEGATAKIGDLVQESGVTANDFSTALTYTLVSADESETQDWVVAVSKEDAATGNDILSFRFESLDPTVNGMVSAADHTVSAEVPSGTDVSALVPTITVSSLATISPESGVAQDFSSPVSYTVTAEDGVSQVWTVTVEVAAAGKTTLFYEDFESLTTIPDTWVIINNDNHPQASGEERWQDSAWVVTTSSRIELAGTKVAMASSYVEMELTDRVDDWLILPEIELGENSTLSWQAMSTTSSGNYPDDYMVLIAPYSSVVTPNVAYFESEANIITTIAPESWSAGVGRPGEGLASHSINLKDLVTPSAPDGWYDQKVWIAFVLITDLYTNPDTGTPNAAAGGSNLAIDNILVVNDASSGIDRTTDGSLAVTLYPNPSSGQLHVNVMLQDEGNAQISVLDVSGREVHAESERLNGGQNQLELELVGLGSGLYLLKVEVDGHSRVQRFVIE